MEKHFYFILGGSYPWYPNKLIPNNSSSFFIECQFIPDFSHLYLNYSFVFWNGKSMKITAIKKIIIFPGIEQKFYGAFMDGGFSIPSPQNSKSLYWIAGGDNTLLTWANPFSSNSNIPGKSSFLFGPSQTINLHVPCSFFSQVMFVSFNENFAVVNCYDNAKGLNGLTYKVRV
jgi:hypothetical protein